MKGLLGDYGAPVVCKVISDDISVHWWEAEGIGPCFCGERTKTVCPNCNGSGQVRPWMGVDDVCGLCNGTGRVEKGEES
jgi:hypothetical protein